MTQNIEPVREALQVAHTRKDQAVVFTFSTLNCIKNLESKNLKHTISYISSINNNTQDNHCQKIIIDKKTICLGLRIRDYFRTSKHDQIENRGIPRNSLKHTS